MTAFYNFALRIEISWAKKIVKPILETWHGNDVIVYVWFYSFWDEKLLTACNVKNNSKCRKFAIRK